MIEVFIIEGRKWSLHLQQLLVEVVSCENGDKGQNVEHSHNPRFEEKEVIKDVSREIPNAGRNLIEFYVMKALGAEHVEGKQLVVHVDHGEHCAGEEKAVKVQVGSPIEQEDYGDVGESQEQGESQSPDLLLAMPHLGIQKLPEEVEEHRHLVKSRNLIVGKADEETDVLEGEEEIEADTQEDHLKHRGDVDQFGDFPKQKPLSLEVILQSLVLIQID